MPILNIDTNDAGHSGVNPRVIRIETNDTLATVTTAGYLTGAVKKMGITLKETDIAAVSTKVLPSDSASEVSWLEISQTSSGVWSLIAPNTPGEVVLPTVANRIPHFPNVSGTLTDTAAAVINLGSIQAGQSGTAGILESYPATALKGSLKLSAVNNSTGDFDTTISNAGAVAQAQVLSIPDSGASTANFLLDTGASNIIAHQEFVGLNNDIIITAGTWLTVRAAQGNYVRRKTAADDTSILCFDVTPSIVIAASKGFRLDSFDIMSTITVAALDAHTVTLDRVVYANNVAVSVNSVAVTGTLPTATQANPYLTNVAIDTPAFNVTAGSKYALELTVDAAATSVYDFNGIMLHFSKTIA